MAGVIPQCPVNPNEIIREIVEGYCRHVVLKLAREAV
jgi:hypothetical protein